MNDPEIVSIDKNGRRQCRLCVNVVRRERNGFTGPRNAYNRNRKPGEPKYCAKCEQFKAESEFYRYKASKDGLQATCKACSTAAAKDWQARNPGWKGTHPEATREHRQAYHRKRNYGVTRTDYQELLATQGGGCAICLILPEDTARGVLSVDHDHKTNKVRGLLCQPCNSGLGQFNDDPNRLMAAATYLIQKGK